MLSVLKKEKKVQINVLQAVFILILITYANRLYENWGENLNIRKINPFQTE
jgi:hypothetical protein